MANWFTDTTPSPLAPPPAAALVGFEPLLRAERILLRACFAGDIAKVGFQRPVGPQAAVTIRGAFLAFLARGGNPAMPVAGRRIQVVGAWIEGRVDLGGANVPLSLWFYRCVFDRPLLLDGAQVGGGVALPACRLPGLLAERCTVGGDLLLNAGCRVSGDVRLSRAVIEGDLRLERLRITAGGDTTATRRAWVADFVRVSGDVILGSGFESAGEVRFVGARIAGNFDASAARLAGTVDALGARRAALSLDGAQVTGDVRFGAGFAAAGAVRLRRSVIGGDLDCTAAGFDVAGDAAWSDGSVLVVERAQIGGVLRLNRLPGPLLGATFEDARAGALLDDASTWGERIVLDGFRYRRLAAGAPADAAFRLGWLGRQPPEHLGTDFRAGPWRQAIRVLRRGGHPASASELAIERERLLRRIGRIGAGLPTLLRGPARALHALLGLVAGYGHRPWRIVVTLGAAWLVCAGAYRAADEHGQIAATPPHAALPAAFDPVVYSLDVLLPGVDLGQQRRFSPAEPGALATCVDEPTATPCMRAGTRWLTWIQGLLGWAGLVTFVACVAGVFDRQRRR